MASSSKRTKSDHVRYFEHFFKNFLRPYGKASESITDDMMEKRLTTFNCEFLNRLGYAFSEFAESLPMAWANIKEQLELVQPRHIRKMDALMSSLQEDLLTIDKKNVLDHTRSEYEVQNSLKNVANFVKKK